MSDDALLAALAEAVRATAGLVDEVAAQGRGVYTWLTIDDDLALAELRHDSESAPAPAVRASPGFPGPRVLVFNAEPLSVELELGAEQIVGQLVPPTAGHVVLETAGGPTYEAAADEYGFFALPAPSTGPFRIRCETESGRLRTDWISP